MRYLAWRNTVSVLAKYGFKSAIIVSRLGLTWAHIREAVDLLREERSAKVDSASSLGAARSKSHVRGPKRSPSGEFLGVFAGVSLLHLLARHILMVQALVEGGAVGFFAKAVRATKPESQDFRNPNVDMNLEERGTVEGVGETQKDTPLLSNCEGAKMFESYPRTQKSGICKRGRR